MIVFFRIGDTGGSLAVQQGEAVVDFPDKDVKEALELSLNSVQEITYSAFNSDGSERREVKTVIPAEEDGTLVYFLNQGVEGITEPIRITDIQGSDRVAFKG